MTKRMGEEKRKGKQRGRMGKGRVRGWVKKRGGTRLRKRKGMGR